MSIDNQTLEQLCLAAKLDLKSEDQSRFLLELESIFHLFHCLDKFTDSVSEQDLPHTTSLRSDHVTHQSLKGYLNQLAHFDETKHMFEVPKVIENE